MIVISDSVVCWLSEALNHAVPNSYVQCLMLVDARFFMYGNKPALKELSLSQWT